MPSLAARRPHACAASAERATCEVRIRLGSPPSQTEIAHRCKTPVALSGCCYCHVSEPRPRNDASHWISSQGTFRAFYIRPKEWDVQALDSAHYENSMRCAAPLAREKPNASSGVNWLPETRCVLARRGKRHARRRLPAFGRSGDVLSESAPMLSASLLPACPVAGPSTRQRPVSQRQSLARNAAHLPASRQSIRRDLVLKLSCLVTITPATCMLFPRPLLKEARCDFTAGTLLDS